MYTRQDRAHVVAPADEARRLSSDSDTTPAIDGPWGLKDTLDAPAYN